VGFTGVPGAGKTSTARGLASTCRRIEKLKNIELLSEYARRYIAKYGTVTQPWEQFRIFKKQLEWEDSVGYADILITDGPVFSSLVYAFMLSSGDTKEIMILDDLFSEMIKLNNPNPRYDVIFHIPPKLTPVVDGVRAKVQFDDLWRTNADSHLYSMYAYYLPPKHLHLVESVSMDDRVAECLEVLDSL
jgi:hypothetical protein